MLPDIARPLVVELDDEIREKVQTEQLRMVWSHASVGTLVATVFAVIMATHFADETGWFAARVWIALKVLVAIPRVVQGQIFRRRGYPGGRKWRLSTYWLLLLDGSVWGVAGAWLVTLDTASASLAIASLVGVVCVATFGLQVKRTATAAYVVPVMAAMIAGLVLRLDLFGAYCAVGLSLLLSQVLITVKRSEAKLSEVFVLRIVLERQSASKSQFLGTVSHELRTPIHGMLGVARVVHVECADPAVKKRMELVEGLGMHLLGLVTDLIDVSRFETGQMRIQSVAFDLEAEIQRVAHIYSVRAAEKGLAFTLDSGLPAPHWVTGDPARVRQVLHNLLGNAIKFTHKGWVDMTVALGEESDLVSFEIRDTGVGINESDQKLVFKAFEQVGAKSDGRRQGTGLGLTIACEIARLLGGGIALKSLPDFGSVFTFTARLPPAAEPQMQPGQTGSAVSSLDLCARILLVEDNDVNYLIASSMLANQGHQVERASDGAEAVHRALRDSDRPDLILMDCMMPTMDGFEAARSIRAQEMAMGLPRIPIIALSASVEVEGRERVVQAGMDDSLGKPFTSDQLLGVMRPWLALIQSERDGGLVGLSRPLS